MAVDGDGQLRNIGEGNISEGHIGDGVGKAVAKTLSGLQLIDRCVSCVERIGVAASGANDQSAVAPGQYRTAVYCARRACACTFSTGANGGHTQGGALGVAVRRGARRTCAGQHVAGNAPAVFGDLMRIINRQRHVVLRRDGNQDGGIARLIGTGTLRTCISSREVAVVEAVA